MYSKLKEKLETLSSISISMERKAILRPLIEYIILKRSSGASVRLNFICTHNSRRSHLAQVWAQTLAYHFHHKDIACYSGGTEGTAVYPAIIETLSNQGFGILKLSEGTNPVIGIKFDENEAPVICFSKAYHHEYNPKSEYCAVMVCDDADENCPVVIGAEARVAITYLDPKIYDHMDTKDQKYLEKSIEIAGEMYYVFSNI